MGRLSKTVFTLKTIAIAIGIISSGAARAQDAADQSSIAKSARSDPSVHRKTVSTGAASKRPPNYPRYRFGPIVLRQYGSRTVATPVVDGLAKDGVLFERAISQVPLTWPSHAVILTGALSVSEWRAGFYRAAARRAVSHGGTGVSATGLSHGRGRKFVRARSELGARTRVRFLR